MANIVYYYFFNRSFVGYDLEKHTSLDIDDNRVGIYTYNFSRVYNGSGTGEVISKEEALSTLKILKMPKFFINLDFEKVRLYVRLKGYKQDSYQGSDASGEIYYRP